VSTPEWGKRAQKIRVPASMLLGIVFLALMHPSVHSLWIGGAVALAGAGLRLWAAGHIEKGKSLAQGGPYAFTRNPLYLGSLLMATGVLVAGQGYWLLLPFGVFYAALYYPVMKTEQEEMQEKYGDKYREYVRRVPVFIPGLGHRSGIGSEGTAGNSSTFLWSRVIRNGEHRTVGGLLLIGAFLFVRAMWPVGWPHL
jgi:protein-S-isoprenylcysteine O-methyltransferase Ste14